MNEAEELARLVSRDVARTHASAVSPDLDAIRADVARMPPGVVTELIQEYRRRERGLVW